MECRLIHNAVSNYKCKIYIIVSLDFDYFLFWSLVYSLKWLYWSFIDRYWSFIDRLLIVIWSNNDLKNTIVKAPHWDINNSKNCHQILDNLNFNVSHLLGPWFYLTNSCIPFCSSRYIHSKNSTCLFLA